MYAHHTGLRGLRLVIIVLMATLVCLSATAIFATDETAAPEADIAAEETGEEAVEVEEIVEVEEYQSNMYATFWSLVPPSSRSFSR